MTPSEQLFWEMRTVAKQTGADPITVALAFKDDPRFKDAVNASNRDLMWNWQAWLHENGDDERRKFFEYPPANVQIMELIDDWKQQRAYCKTCQRGDKCIKTTQKFIADLEQVADGRGGYMNYVVYYPCKYNKIGNKQRQTGQAAKFNETGSDLL